MPWIAAAATIGGSLLSSNSQSKAASSAASAQSQATGLSTEELKRQFDLARSDQMPWLKTGGAALGKLSGLLGLDSSTLAPEQTRESFNSAQYLTANPDVADQARSNSAIGYSPDQFAWDHFQKYGKGEGRTYTGNAEYNSLLAKSKQAALHPPADYGSLLKPFSMASYTADPGYQFRLSEGQKSIDAAARAHGLYGSGGTLKELTQYGSDLASQEYGSAYSRYNNDQSNVFNRLSGVAGTGQQTAQSLAATGSATAGRLSDIYTGQGNSNAAALIAQGNARASGYEGVAGALSGYFKNRLSPVV